MDCKCYKFSDPNGFNLSFLQNQDRTLLTSSFVKSPNSTFLVFIPKFEGATNSKDFMPISLVSEVYKTIAKVLTKRISEAMEMVVGIS